MPFFTNLDPNALGQYLRDITFPDSDGMGGTYERTIRSDARSLTHDEMLGLLDPGADLRAAAPEDHQSDEWYTTDDILEDVLSMAPISACFEHRGYTIHMLNWLDGDAQLLFGIFDEETMLLQLENNDAKKSYRWQRTTLTTQQGSVTRCWVVRDREGGNVWGVYTDRESAEAAVEAGDGVVSQSTLHDH
jgi:hypothetical protein